LRAWVWPQPPHGNGGNLAALNGAQLGNPTSIDATYSQGTITVTPEPSTLVLLAAAPSA
jgi:hypothetical protein